MHEVAYSAYHATILDLEKRGIDKSRLLTGLNLSAGEPMPNERLNWSDFVLVVGRYREIVGSDYELIKMGQGFAENPAYSKFNRLLKLTISLPMMFRMLSTAFSRDFVHIQVETVMLPDKSWQVALWLPTMYEDSEAFFHVIAGGFATLPSIAGLGRAEVEYEIFPRKAVYYVTPPSERRWYMKLFAVPGTLFRILWSRSKSGERWEHLALSHADLIRRNEELIHSNRVLSARTKILEAISKAKSLDRILHDIGSALRTSVGDLSAVELLIRSGNGKEVRSHFVSGMVSGKPLSEYFLQTTAEDQLILRVWSVDESLAKLVTSIVEGLLEPISQGIRLLEQPDHNPLSEESPKYPTLDPVSQTSQSASRQLEQAERRIREQDVEDAERWLSVYRFCLLRQVDATGPMTIDVCCEALVANGGYSAIAVVDYSDGGGGSFAVQNIWGDSGLLDAMLALKKVSDSLGGMIASDLAVQLEFMLADSHCVVSGRVNGLLLVAVGDENWVGDQLERRKLKSLLMTLVT